MSAPLLGSMCTSVTADRPAAFPIIQPQKFPRKPSAPFTDLESSLSRLHASKGKWTATSCKERLDLMQQAMKNLIRVSPGLASDSCKAKGSWGGGIGEEMAGLVSIALGLSGYCDLLAAEGQPRPLSMRKREDGQEIASVFPTGLVGLLFGGFTGEVWLQKGKGSSQGEFYRAKSSGGRPLHDGKVSLVLGAGNQVSVVALDVLHKLIIEDEVVLLKLNPVNEYIGPHIEELFSPFIDNGWLELCYGGKEVGEYLTGHALVDSIHLTGSSDTFNAIYWGSPKPQGLNLKPRITKPFTAELGNVTSYFIVPPPKGTSWTREEIVYHAKNLTAALMQNQGCNCVALELIVTSADWEQREEFMSTFAKEMNKRPRLTPSYPGVEAKVASFRQHFPDAKELGSIVDSPSPSSSSSSSSCPLLLADNLKPEQARYNEESWGPMVQEIVLPSAAGKVQGFLDQAIELSRTKCWGSLACSVVAHPSSVKEVGEVAFDDFIAQLKYGTVSVNVPCLISFALPSLSWGAFPGHTPEDIKSGTGHVHNTMAFDYPEKSVLWAPFIFRPYPFWFCDHRNLEKTITGTLKFIAAGGARNGGPGLFGTLRCLGLLTTTALEAIKG